MPAWRRSCNGRMLLRSRRHVYFKCLAGKPSVTLPTFKKMSLNELYYPQPLHNQTLFDGSRMAFVEKGTGAQTLILIHGMGNNLLSWHNNFEALSDTYHCIAVDLPGNGASPNSPDGNYSLDYFARCLIDFIGRKGLRNVTLVGHSMGAQIAVRVALQAPPAVAGLVLIAPAGLERFTVWERTAAQATFFMADYFQPPEQMLASFFEHGFNRMPKEGRKLLQHCLQDFRQHGDAPYRKMLTQCVSSMFGEPVIDELAGVKAPTLIIFGGADALIPNKMWHPNLSPATLAESAVSKMQTAKSKVIPQAGHFVHWEASEEVNAAIRIFVGMPAEMPVG